MYRRSWRTLNYCQPLIGDDYINRILPTTCVVQFLNSHIWYDCELLVQCSIRTLHNPDVRSTNISYAYVAPRCSANTFPYFARCFMKYTCRSFASTDMNGNDPRIGTDIRHGGTRVPGGRRLHELRRFETYHTPASTSTATRSCEVGPSNICILACSI